MAVYGISLYGEELYGLTGFGARAGRGFSAEPFTVEATDPPPSGVGAGPAKHGQLYLRWQIPVGDWTTQRVVRHYSGFPTNIFDGQVVYEGPKADQVGQFLDTGLTEGLTVYYSIFVQAASDGVWFRAADQWALVLKDHGFDDLLGYALPDAALRADWESSQSLPDHLKYPLARFLQVFGYEFDRVRTTLDSVRNLYNPDATPAPAVSLLSEQFGVPAEPSIGIARLRTLARNASFLNGSKGTKGGVEALASAFTGYSATVTTGKNLALRDDYPDWTVGSPHTMLTPPFADSDIQFALQFGGASVANLRSADVAGRERFYAVPVEVDVQYTYSVEVQPESTARDVTLLIRRYEADGTFIDERVGTATSTADNVWTVVSYTFTNTDPGGTPPAFVELAIDVAAGVANEEHYFKNVQLEEASSYTSYEPPRQAVITFTPPFVNEITTPSFEDAVAPAFTVTNTTPAFSSVEARYGTDSWDLTPTAAATDTTVTSDDKVSVTIGDPVTARCSVFPANDVDLTLEIEWLDGVDAVIGSTSQVFSLTGGTWNDLFLQEQETTGNALSARFKITWQDEQIYLDGVLLARTYGVEYFDGDTLSGETEWTGTDHNSTSTYFPLKAVRQFRLTSVLPDFLRVNQQWDLVYATTN